MSLKVYRTPQPDNDELRVIELIDALREEMKHRLSEPRRWSGSLRRMLEAHAVQASNSIEGYNATLSDVLATADGEQPMEADEATRQAVTGYREAMTYVLQLTQDSTVTVDEGLLKSLHFMMLKYDLGKNPGRWRPGAVFVRRANTGEIVHEGPPSDQVPGLIESALDQLENVDVPALIRGAMAHLNLVMIHPFSDGNGRMARCLQTLVLAREQIVAPVFSSIEEYLGRNTAAYYEILAETGQGRWSPDNDAHPWVRFCLTAHYRQAKSVLRRTESFEAMWRIANDLADEHRLPDRCVGPICEAAFGLRVRRATYVANVEVTYGKTIPDLTASRDLKALVNAGLFEPIGDTKGRYYLATERLKSAWQQARDTRPPRDMDDPFALVAESDQLDLATT